MSHLSLETIARLVEEEPDTAEAAHLASCTECRTQLEAMTEDVHALAMLPDMAAAPDQWDALERRLADEGLIRTRSQRLMTRSTGLMQFAAALMLILGGGVAGRMTAPEPVRMATVDRSDSVPADPAGSARDAERLASQPRTADRPASAVEQEPLPADVSSPRPVTLAANGAGDRAPATMEEAARFLRETEARYLDALTGYAELASQAQTGDPVARLAALQSIILTTQAALTETPTDPVINGYHLAALAQRDATLQQVAQASTERWY